MRRKKYSLIVWAGILMLSLAGCGAKKTDFSEEIQVQQKSDEEETVTLEVYAWQDEENNISVLAEEFMRQNPEIRIHTNFVPISEYSQQMMSLKSNSRQADCIFSPNAAEAVVWKNKDMLESMEEWIDPAETKEAYDIWYNDGEEECSFYMRPYRKSRWAVYYNKELFEEKGIACPGEDWTWEEYARTAIALTDDTGETPVYGSLSFEPTNLWWRVPARTAGANDPFCQEDLEEFRKAAQWCYDLTYESGAQMSYREQMGKQGNSYDANFLEGNIGMYFSGDWSVASLNERIAREHLEITYDIAPMPHWEGEESYVISDAAVVSMLKKTEYPEQTWKFIEFVTGAEGAKLLAQHNIIPAYRSEEIKQIYLSAEEYPEHREYFFMDGEISRVPANSKYSEAMEIVKGEVSLYLLQEQSLEKTFDTISEELELLH
ncbi:MAG: ABC transporter substrate-binding protein [Fusicatenibacter sp.]